MKYLAVLGRLSDISLAELTAFFGDSVKKIAPSLAVFETDKTVNINRFGGTMKFGQLIASDPVDFLLNLKDADDKDFSGKIVLGVSDYSKGASSRKANSEAMKLKKILSRKGRSVRVLSNKSAALSTATSHHNQLSEKPGHVELLIVGKEYYSLIGVQNITAYAKRDQARPARDAKVGMLPPKLAQILINLCGDLKPGSTILDPFCGTGVVLQEAHLMGYNVYGTDLSDRMIEYSKKNLEWLSGSEKHLSSGTHSGALAQVFRSREERYFLETGDATEHTWNKKIDAVACETYLGAPMSLPPVDIKLKEQKAECSRIILGFLKNISAQIESGTPLAIAVPAWLRPNGHYERLNILDSIEDLGYNVLKFNHLGQTEMLYHRDGQVVAREIIVLRKK